MISISNAISLIKKVIIVILMVFMLLLLCGSSGDEEKLTEDQESLTNILFEASNCIGEDIKTVEEDFNEAVLAYVQEQEELAAAVEPEPDYITMTVVVSAYCNEAYDHICNNGDSTTTATGTTPTVGRTIAVDPDMIPYGSEVEIDGHIYIAEDCGGSITGNRIDLLFATHQEALEYGMQTKTIKVYIK